MRTTAPCSPRPPLEKRRSWGSIILWTLVLLVLAGAGVAVWMEMEGGPRLAREEEIPPPPDSVPDILPGEVLVPETIGTQPELDAFVENQEGIRLLREGDLAGALEQFRVARQLSPENPDYGYNFAYALLQAGQFGPAASEFQRVAGLDPGRAGTYYNLAMAQLQLGDTAAAWTNLQRVPQLAAEPAQRAAALRAIRDIERAQTQPQQPIPMDTSTVQTPAPDTVRPTAAPRRDTTAAPRDTARGGE